MSRMMQANRVEQEQQVTCSQSQTLVKNLVRTAISSIAYIRNLFPEDCFEKKGFSGTNIRMQLPNSEASSVLYKWLEEGVFEALEKEYLSDLIFAIYTPGIPDDILVECYEFHLDYFNGVPDLKLSVQKKEVEITYTREKVRDSTARLIRTLILLTETLNELPANRYVSIKLQYREDVTPADYEPKYFTPGEQKDELMFQQSPYKVTVGAVDTKYHSTTLKVKTTAGMFKEDYNPQQQQEQNVDNASPNEQNIENLSTNIINMNTTSTPLYHALPSIHNKTLTSDEQTLVDHTGLPCPKDKSSGILFDIVADRLVKDNNFTLAHACRSFPHQRSAVVSGILDKMKHRGLGIPKNKTRAYNGDIQVSGSNNTENSTQASKPVAKRQRI